MGTIPMKVVDRFTKTIPKYQKVLKIAKDKKFYRRSRTRPNKQEKTNPPTSTAQEDVSFSDKLLKESQEE